MAANPTSRQRRTATAGWAAVGAAIAAFGLPSPAGLAQSVANATLTRIEGIRVGHHTLTARPTGCTVVIVDGGATAGVVQRGAAPGTRDTALLDPLGAVDHVDAIVLSGGSAYGLDAANG